MEDLLVGGDEPGRAYGVFAGAGVARIARVRAAGYLDANAMAAGEAVGGGPQLEPHGGDVVVVARRLVGRQPYNASTSASSGAVVNVRTSSRASSGRLSRMGVRSSSVAPPSAGVGRAGS